MLRASRSRWLALGTALAVLVLVLLFAWLRNAEAAPVAPAQAGASFASVEPAR